MGLLGFIDTTFILTLGIVLLICGGIMIYCYRRLNALENGLIQQGRVMQEFITNYNLTMQMRDSTNHQRNNQGSDLAVVNSNSLELPSREDKIVVSDDDLSDDDLSDDQSDDSEVINNIVMDDDISDVEEIENIDIGTDIEEIINNGPNRGRNIELDSTNLTIDKLDIDLDAESLQSDIKEALKEALHSDLKESLKESLQSDLQESLQSDLQESLQSDLQESLQSDLTDISSRIIPIVDIEGQDTSKKNPSRLKVDELRELVVNKNLVSNDEAQKLKKGELVRLLE